MTTTKFVDVYPSSRGRQFGEYETIIEVEYATNSKGGVMYSVKKLTCNCPPWIFNKRGNRTCRHTDESVRKYNL